jgi:hypothetical protein
LELAQASMAIEEIGSWWMNLVNLAAENRRLAFTLPSESNTQT